jgi:putative tricarboxylic transport membrane protein
MATDLKATGRARDFWSGVIFLAAGLVSAGLARSYPMGTTMRMGPGYFPTVLGGLLALIGLILIVRALLQPGPAVGRLAYSKLALVTASTVLFALFLRRLGLSLVLVLLVVVSAYASRRFRWPVALALAVGLAVGSSIIFVRLLGLPIPVFGSWLGG